MQQTVEDYKKENRQLSNKVKQLTNGTIKELQRKVGEKENEVEVLKEMVRSGQLQIKGKDRELDHYKRKVERMLKKGYVDKIQASYPPKVSNYDYNTHQEAYYTGVEEDGDYEGAGANNDIQFYDASEFAGRVPDDEITQSQGEGKSLMLPEISTKSGIPSQQHKNQSKISNAIFDNDFSEQRMSKGILN